MPQWLEGLMAGFPVLPADLELHALAAALIARAFAIAPLLVLARWLSPFGLAALEAVPSALPPVRAVRAGAAGRALLPVRGLTATLETVYALCL